MARRRANDEGTVFKDKHGVWWAQLPPDDRGRRPKRRAKTQREAMEKLRELQRERERGLTLAAKQPTLTQFLETWLNEVAPNVAKAHTVEDYRYIVQHYIVPQLGTHRLDKLKPAHVQAWLNALLTRVSAGTARNAYNRLHTALGVAVKWRLVAENVAGLVDPPNSAPRPIQTLTIEQAGRLLDAVKEHRLYALYYLALRLGLREAELLGLLWADLDWTKGTLRVSGQIQRVGRQTVRTTTKTKKSERALPLDEDLLNVLRAHWQNQLEEKRLPDNGWKEHGLILASERGTPLGARNLVRHFKAALKRAGLPSIRFHDLRHTAGSLMLSEGAHLTDVAEVLGHSSPMITARIYAHSYDEGKRRAIAGTGRLLRQEQQ
jgi:integrase